MAKALRPCPRSCFLPDGRLLVRGSVALLCRANILLVSAN
jgi:hypothetical protein